MEYVYHGSKIKGLEKIIKRSSTHQKEWVYASLSKVAAITFIRNCSGLFHCYLDGSGTKESPIILVERKAGMFNKMFNLSGSLYTLSSAGFENGKTEWDGEVVSEHEEAVLSEEHIDNVLNKLAELMSNNEVKLYYYPDRPKFIPIDNSDLIPLVIDLYKKGFDRIIDEFLQIYPELEEKTNREVGAK